MTYDSTKDRDRVILAAAAYSGTYGRTLTPDGGPFFFRPYATGYGVLRQHVDIEAGDWLRLRRMVTEGLLLRQGEAAQPNTPDSSRCFTYSITQLGLDRLMDTSQPIKRKRNVSTEIITITLTNQYDQLYGDMDSDTVDAYGDLDGWSVTDDGELFGYPTIDLTKPDSETEAAKRLHDYRLLIRRSSGCVVVLRDGNDITAEIG